MTEAGGDGHAATVRWMRAGVGVGGRGGEAGGDVVGSRPREPSLEEIFLDVAGGDDDGPRGAR